MRVLKTGLLVAGVLAFILGLCSCNTLAMSGPKKYKVDLSNLLLLVKSEIESSGEVSAKTTAKFENYLEAQREEYGTKGSFIRASDALKFIQASQALVAEGKNGFQELQEAKQSIFQSQDMLKTEVKDD